jgi:hypothetical protein
MGMVKGNIPRALHGAEATLTCACHLIRFTNGGLGSPRPFHSCRIPNKTYETLNEQWFGVCRSEWSIPVGNSCVHFHASWHLLARCGLVFDPLCACRSHRSPLVPLVRVRPMRNQREDGVLIPGGTWGPERRPRRRTQAECHLRAPTEGEPPANVHGWEPKKIRGHIIVQNRPGRRGRVLASGTPPSPSAVAVDNSNLVPPRANKCQLAWKRTRAKRSDSVNS